MGTVCSCSNDGDSSVEKDIGTDDVNSSKVELIDEQMRQESLQTPTKANCSHTNHTNVDGNNKSLINQSSSTVIENSKNHINNVKNVEYNEVNGHVPEGKLSSVSPMGVGDNENFVVKVSSTPATILIPEDLTLVNLAPLIKQAQDLVANATALSPEDEDLVANMTTELASLVSRLEQAVIRLEKAGGPGTANRVAQGSAPSSSQ
ncbi:unnamed protein product, partial [Meganyctiphanes norvegica]